MTSVRVGQGFDIHRFSDDPDRVLVLGRRRRSPASAGWTATAMPTSSPTPSPMRCSAPPVSATSAQHFPDTDPAWRGADSLALLRRVAGMVAERGWTVGNVDCSVVCEGRSWHRIDGRDATRLSEAAGAPVTVKGRRAEGLGALGRGEGIACWAVAVIDTARHPAPARATAQGGTP